MEIIWLIFLKEKFNERRGLMKIFIWFICFFISGIIQVFIPEITPLVRTLIFVGACILARKLCKIWSEKHDKGGK